MNSLAHRVVKRAKQAALAGARRSGVFSILGNSSWRQQRLLILCYHGVSLEDEHRWNPSLYMSQSGLRRRFELLREHDCHVLPLAEAIERLYARDLPARAVALTFDDGYHDFMAAAWPMLREFGYPATVYLATLRCDRNLPIFNLAVPLMFWRRGGVHDARAVGLGRLDLQTAASRADAWRQVKALAGTLNPERKDQLARDLSDAIGGDYGSIAGNRLVTIMRPADVTRLAAEGLDVQLHTHRHRTPQTRDDFEDEIARNRERILELTGRVAEHFCYPSGLYGPDFRRWLAEAGIVSATTCDPALADARTDPRLLPRLVDHEELSAIEFEAWLAGAATLTARKAAAYRGRAAVTAPS